MSSIIVGIDYSMSSPAVCIHLGPTWSFQNCIFYSLTNKKKYAVKTKNIITEFHADFSSQEERFDNISSWAISLIPKNSEVFIEDYAFAAKGIVFNIGENCGLLKHKLYKNNICFSTISPPTIKKFATKKGNSNKIVMYEFFVEETKFDVCKFFGCKIGDSPASDIIDSYFICKFGFSHNRPRIALDEKTTKR